MSNRGQVRRLLRRLRHGDWRWARDAVLDRIAPAHPALHDAALAVIRDRIGLEIGGPSRVFARRGLLPVYNCAARIDNVNFASATRWEHGLRDEGPYEFSASRAPGTQYVREAVSLSGVADETYDFVLSSHCLEHVANPLAALREWHRVTRPEGHLVLVIPDPARTFDHRRPITTLDHLRDDFSRARGEDDRTHFDEVLALHDLSRDPGAGSAEEFRQRVQENLSHRCVHHHVFDRALIAAALRETGWREFATEAARPCHLIALARKELA